ncbi:MAG TPA: hypothetical protein VGX95_14330 [Xanthobacteraceae bacterium]|nr:hypothetical protein [Xanthobacteraceae bacterium]
MTTASIDLRPAPVLAIGIVGHRRIGIAGEAAQAVEAALERLLQDVDALFRKIVAAERPFFSGAEPILRVVGTAADGSGLLAARAARTIGAELACVLPFAPEEYAKDFSTPAARALAEAIIGAAPSVFVLPGTRAEGARAYERANDVVLSNIDLLVAVWDGARAEARAGTGEIVQAAIASGIPVIVIPLPFPHRLAGESGVGARAPAKLLLSPGEDQLDRPVATDLAGEPLDGLPGLLREIVAPPAGADKRQGLADLYREQPGRHPRRFEYPLLLKMFRVNRLQVRNVATAPHETYEPAPPLAELRLRIQAIDEFGVYYGRLFRSSNASAFLLIIFAALFSAILSNLFLKIFGMWLFGQLIVTALVLLDAAIGSKRRWHERWLDYRLIAERLRCLRFLHPLGLGLDRACGAAWQPKQSWAEWYVRRSERAAGPPAGAMGPADFARLAHWLADVEIAGQFNYHRRAFRQLGLLEQRLAGVARIVLWVTPVAALIGVWAVDERHEQAQLIASLILFALPAVTSAFNGLRAEADLVRLAERSAAAAVALARLRRVIDAAAPTYDRVAVAAMRAAAIMAGELSDWRFVLERRRARSRRPALGGRKRRRAQ